MSQELTSASDLIFPPQHGHHLLLLLLPLLLAAAVDVLPGPEGHDHLGVIVALGVGVLPPLPVLGRRLHLGLKQQHRECVGNRSDPELGACGIFSFFH